MTHSDEALEFWGARFCRTSLSKAMTFEAFMALPATLRERRLAFCSTLGRILMRDRDVRALKRAELHGQQLIEPLHHARVGMADRGPLVRLRRTMK